MSVVIGPEFYWVGGVWYAHSQAIIAHWVCYRKRTTHFLLPSLIFLSFFWISCFSLSNTNNGGRGDEAMGAHRSINPKLLDRLRREEKETWRSSARMKTFRKSEFVNLWWGDCWFLYISLRAMMICLRFQILWVKLANMWCDDDMIALFRSQGSIFNLMLIL